MNLMLVLGTLVFAKKMDGLHAQGFLCREFGGDDGQGNHCKSYQNRQTQVKAPDSVEDDFREDKAYQSTEGCSDKRSEESQYSELQTYLVAQVGKRGSQYLLQVKLPSELMCFFSGYREKYSQTRQY